MGALGNNIARLASQRLDLLPCRMMCERLRECKLHVDVMDACECHHRWDYDRNSSPHLRAEFNGNDVGQPQGYLSVSIYQHGSLVLIDATRWLMNPCLETPGCERRTCVDAEQRLHRPPCRVEMVYPQAQQEAS